MGLFKRFIIVTLVVLTSLSAFARKKSKKKYYAGFGPAFFTNLNVEDFSPMLSGGVYWKMGEQFDLQAGSELGLSLEHSDVLFITPQIKGRYFFSAEENNTYYTSVGMGYGLATTHAESGRASRTAKGFVFSGGFGLQAFRDKKMQVSIGVEHTIILDESTSGTPIATFVTLAIFFK